MKISKKAFVFFLSLSFVIGITASAFADEAMTQITATLDKSITVTLDGEAQTLRDANGNVVYPIVYNGSTYLPVRPISNLFGVEIGWEQNTKTVSLGGSAATTQPVPTPDPTPDPDPTPAAGDKVDLAAAMGSGNKYCWKLSDPGDLVVNGETFTSGIYRDIWNSSSSSSSYTLITHDVSGKTSVTFTGWSDIDANIIVMDQNGGTISSFPVDANSFITKTVDITQYDEIAFGANAQKAGKNGAAKILNPITE